LNSLVDKGYLICDDSHRPYAYCLAKNVDPSTLKTFNEVLSNYCDYDLEYFCENRGLTIRMKDEYKPIKDVKLNFPRNYISPITGKLVYLSPDSANSTLPETQSEAKTS
jgi:hypothetical protein